MGPPFAEQYQPKPYRIAQKAKRPKAMPAGQGIEATTSMPLSFLLRAMESPQIRSQP
jgi:hypothetical protein